MICILGQLRSRGMIECMLSVYLPVGICGFDSRMGKIRTAPHVALLIVSTLIVPTSRLKFL